MILLATLGLLLSGLPFLIKSTLHILSRFRFFECCAG